MANFVTNPCRVIGSHLADTSNTTIYTVNGYAQVIGIRCANLTGADTGVTVNYYSHRDSDQYRLIYQHLVPANGAIWLPLEAFAMAESDEIRVQAEAANAIDAILSVAEIPGRSQ